MNKKNPTSAHPELVEGSSGPRAVHKKLTIPNILTLLRIFCVPFIIANIVSDTWPTATLFFVIAALTDIVDGWLARYLQQETELGAYLDPVADKILFVSCYGALLYHASAHTPQGITVIPAWFCYFMLAKELLLAGGAFYVGVIKKTHEIRPSVWGKLATFVQSCFVGLVCVLFLFKLEGKYTGSVQFFLVLIISLSVISFIDYAIRAYKQGKNYAKIS